MVSQLKSVQPTSLRRSSARSDRRPALYTIEGTLQVFTAASRTFFTHVMVQAMRAAGQGTSVLVVQFLKGGIDQGRDRPMQFGQNLDWLRCDISNCLLEGKATEAEQGALQELWQHTQQVIMQGKYGLVVLDELSLAIAYGLIAEADVLNFLRDRPSRVDVIMTGPMMPESILDIADQVTQVRRSFLS
ncbi:MAG: P-loop NTPase family protein [Cyanobacteria bacterium P01_H01_bin.119]